MAETIPISRAERSGLIEARRLLAALRKRGDEHARIEWVWHGAKLIALEVKFKTLIES